jgi:hypothetical protein
VVILHSPVNILLNNRVNLAAILLNKVATLNPTHRSTSPANQASTLLNQANTRRSNLVSTRHHNQDSLRSTHHNNRASILLSTRPITINRWTSLVSLDTRHHNKEVIKRVSIPRLLGTKHIRRLVSLDSTRRNNLNITHSRDNIRHNKVDILRKVSLDTLHNKDTSLVNTRLRTSTDSPANTRLTTVNQRRIRSMGCGF